MCITGEKKKQYRQRHAVVHHMLEPSTFTEFETKGTRYSSAVCVWCVCVCVCVCVFA